MSYGNWIPQKKKYNHKNHDRIGITHQGWLCMNKFFYVILYIVE
jgi:hypothetical protein